MLYLFTTALFCSPISLYIRKFDGRKTPVCQKQRGIGTQSKFFQTSITVLKYIGRCIYNTNLLKIVGSKSKNPFRFSCQAWA